MLQMITNPPEPTETTPMPVSVLICTRNRPDDLSNALPGIMAQDYPDYEVVIIDQSTNDDSERQTRAQFGADPRLRYVRTGTKGLSIARNLAVAAAQYEICAFTDDDCEAHPKWLTNIAELYRAHPETQIGFSPVHVPPDIAELPDAVFPSLYFEDERQLNRGEIFGMGANMSLRKSFWERVGAFDTLLGAGAPMPGAEEHDWMYRAHRMGAIARLEPKNSIYHRSWRSVNQWESVMNSYGMGDAAFAMKHLRCGDLQMLGKIAYALGYIFARGCLRIVQGKKRPAEFWYTRGYWRGLVGSLKFRVDKRARLYETPPAAPTPSGDPLQRVA